MTARSSCRGAARPWTALLVLAVLVPALASAADKEDWRKGSGFGVSAAVGLGPGGQGYSARYNTAGMSDSDSTFLNQIQWSADVRALAPHLGSGSFAPRPYLRGVVTAPFGAATAKLLRGGAVSPVEGTMKLEYRWQLGLGLSFPIELGGSTFCELNPSLSYARERIQASFTAIGNPGQNFSEARSALKLDEVVPGIEVSFPIAHWGELGRYGRTGKGRLDLTVGGDVPIVVGDRGTSLTLGTTGSGNPIAVTAERDRVGYSAYALARVTFEGF